jgi:hypothetical protein
MRVPDKPPQRKPAGSYRASSKYARELKKLHVDHPFRYVQERF